MPCRSRDAACWTSSLVRYRVFTLCSPLSELDGAIDGQRQHDQERDPGQNRLYGDFSAVFDQIIDAVIVRVEHVRQVLNEIGAEEVLEECEDHRDRPADCTANGETAAFG